jgi:hypothetical protein
VGESDIKRFDLLVAVCVLAVLPFLMGANIQMTQCLATVNGQPFRLDESGTFALQGTEVLIYINCHATNATTGQNNFITAAANQPLGTWSGTLFVVPGNYNCFARLWYRPQPNGPATPLDTAPPVPRQVQ